MSIGFRSVSLFAVAVFGLTFAQGATPAAGQPERIAASFVLALGRAPSAGEIRQWAGEDARSISELVARHRQQLQGDGAAREAVAVKAWKDAYGRSPTAAEISAEGAAGSTYTGLMERHVRWLAGHPADYAQVVGRAYRLVISRDVYPEEIGYWSKQDALPFAVLVGCVDDWARRNQPGLMVTAGTATVSVNCEYLATVRLSPALAAEARAAVGLAPASDAAALGRNLIAAGAEKIASSGRIHFVAAGAADLVTSGKVD